MLPLPMQPSGPEKQPTPTGAAGASWPRVASGVVQGLIFVAYPVAIYFAHTRLGTRALAAVLLLGLGAGAVLRLRGSWGDSGELLQQHLGIAVMIALAIALDDPLYLLFLPAAVSAYLLYTFSRSLRVGPPMIERFARLIEDDLPEFTLPYCRAVTKLWCGFLAFNAVVVCVLAIGAPLGWWAIYSGGIFYALLLLVLAGEFVFRKLWFRYYTGGPADELLSRWFPAEQTARGQRSLAYEEGRRRASPSPSP